MERQTCKICGNTARILKPGPLQEFDWCECELGQYWKRLLSNAWTVKEIQEAAKSGDWGKVISEKNIKTQP